jgi:hypothetical protein
MDTIMDMVVKDTHFYFNGFLTVHHSVNLNFHQLNAQFYLFNNNITS